MHVLIAVSPIHLPVVVFLSIRLLLSLCAAEKGVTVESSATQSLVLQLVSCWSSFCPIQFETMVGRIHSGQSEQLLHFISTPILRTPCLEREQREVRGQPQVHLPDRLIPRLGAERMMS